MSSSPHKIRFSEPPRDIQVRGASETFISKEKLRAELEERYRAGCDAGQKALAQELVQQRSQLLEIQNNVLRSIERALPALARQCEKELIALALDAARRVVHSTPISPEMIEAAIKSGLAELQGTTEYEVRLNPEDYSLLQTVQSPALPSSNDGKIVFTADPAISRAACLINTRHGAIELNREAMFKKLEDAALC